MTDTAPEIEKPFLDLDKMLEDLHNDFQDPSGDISADVPEEGSDPPDGGNTGDPEPATPGDGSGSAPDAAVLPPGMVDFAGEIMPLEEAKALLELNRQVKEDPAKAERVRSAVLGEASPAQGIPDPNALPEWLDPDDTQAVFLYRQNRKIEQEQAELRQHLAARDQRDAVAAERTRKEQVVDAWKDAISSFHGQHPELDMEDLKGIADRAGQLHLLDSPEAVGGSLRGGFEVALDAAMWATPQYRDKALAGATVRTKEQQAEDRKRKSSALSSSSGSQPRTQSQEARPTTRSEIMAQGLEFLRSGANLTD